MFLLIRRGFNRVMIHTNRLEVVKALHDSVPVNLGIIVLRQVQQILLTEGQWLVRFVLR
ncbi:hypothetical protein Goshw_018975, partial [Gossypium schwendimanii]|nr:hypothetical protein [Gossypium schwendimanii]